MNYHPSSSIQKLHPDLQKILVQIRQQRHFDVAAYVDAKVHRLMAYMQAHQLTTCVLAVSGGVDSAVTYALIQEAKRREGSPIQTVIPIFLPVYHSDGATNQDSAYRQAAELVSTISSETLIEIDLSPVHELLKIVVDQAMHIHGESWASGQLVSYLRTPAYYYITSLLSQSHHRAIVCGTTNRDEGAYLGYFGKASDGMVDVQLISDIHKSEVFSVAKALGIPASIQHAVPTGDMYDHRSDEEVFGAPYDFVELYLNVLPVMDSTSSSSDILGKDLSPEAVDQFRHLQQNLEQLHNYNQHKYLGASPAVHLDVLASHVPGGWHYRIWGDES